MTDNLRTSPRILFQCDTLLCNVHNTIYIRPMHVHCTSYNVRTSYMHVQCTYIQAKNRSIRYVVLVTFEVRDILAFSLP